MINQPTVGKLIRDLRLALGLTQEQFAASVAVTYSTINRWENGRSKPSPMAMKLIEQKLDEMGAQGQDLLVKYLPN
ncbi:helix-turn-helix domain-containing protein [Tolypothrix sp. NIES-4075]|uniref:helix-turn-helix domain-containing protein n=1 Tax=Tolypothrix sp. NIES-4075 TaxID=2005459 RepID=UPI00352D2418